MVQAHAHRRPEPYRAVFARTTLGTPALLRAIGPFNRPVELHPVLPCECFRARRLSRHPADVSCGHYKTRF